MQNFYMEQNLWKYIYGKVEVPSNIDSKYEEQGSDIEEINSWIANPVGPTIGAALAKFKHPEDVRQGWTWGSVGLSRDDGS